MRRLKRAGASAASASSSGRQQAGAGSRGPDRTRRAGASAATSAKRERAPALRAGARSPKPADAAPGILREQQPPEWRLARVPGARPPDHGLVAGAGQRDVGEAQLLAALLDVVLVQVDVVFEPAPSSTSIARWPSSSWKPDGLALVGEAAGLPQERAVHDREFEALAAVEGEHLDRVGVGVQAPRALVV